MTTPQMDWLDDQRRKRAVSSDEQTFTKCCQGCDPSCDGPAACADRAWTEIERLREQVQYRDDVIAMLRREVSVLRDELRLAGEEASRG